MLAALASRQALPQDVTPEEVAAIAAAAAQIKSLCRQTFQNEASCGSRPLQKRSLHPPQITQSQAEDFGRFPHLLSLRGQSSRDPSCRRPRFSETRGRHPLKPQSPEAVLPVEPVPVLVPAEKTSEAAETSASESQDGSDTPVTMAVQRQQKSQPLLEL